MRIGTRIHGFGLLLATLALITLALPARAETYHLQAPTEPLEAVVHAKGSLTLELRYRGRLVARTPA
ncbi:MAG TPA: hypothetical protein VHF86_05280, partial [Xanthomonadaceae bacterium]|nr:hypothetical protein [Xanthomonadaceae bacterium]